MHKQSSNVQSWPGPVHRNQLGCTIIKERGSGFHDAPSLRKPMATEIEDQRTEEVQALKKVLPPSILESIALAESLNPRMKQLEYVKHLLKGSNYSTLAPLLPVLFQLRGKPYHINDHFAFAPLFKTLLSRRCVLKTARQVSKSTTNASRGLLTSICVPHFTSLYITPYFEMIRRFSSNYVAPFLEQSAFRKALIGTGLSNNVLQRSFSNGSNMIFSFAAGDADRVRGVSANWVVIDEIQDVDFSLIPVIMETKSADLVFGLETYTGTPKTVDNTLERVWTESSMAEWVIKCHHAGCNHFNIPSMDYDLDKMHGKFHRDISEKTPGIVCAKCQKPLLPRPPSQGGFGRWVHRIPERRQSFDGYHVPQQIMPMHYAHPEKWAFLLGKRSGKGSYSQREFNNEVCGESFDSGAKLVTVADLISAATLPWSNNRYEAINECDLNQYIYRVLAVDWGGGGGNPKAGSSEFMSLSYTAYAVLGLHSSGSVHVLYGHRSLTPLEHVREAKIASEMMRDFACSHLIHDATGAGNVRETIVVQSGLAKDRIVPVVYAGPSKGGLVEFRPSTPKQFRSYYSMDRNRALNYMCQFVKSGIIRFFKYDYVDKDNVGLLNDFVNLIEDKRDSASGRTVYRIARDPYGPDDFAQACTMGTMMLYHMLGKYPDLSAYVDIDVPEGYDDELYGSDELW